MTPDEYQKAALRTENTPLFVNHARRDISPLNAYSPEAHAALEHDRMLSRLLHAVLGMITELGEFCDPLKRHLIYDADFGEEQKANGREEIGDESWYQSLAADALGAKLETILERNIAKLRARFPDRFTSEKALNRDLDAEKRALERPTRGERDPSDHWQHCADILACENKPETIIKCLRILVDANQANVLALERFREATHY